MSFMPTQVTDPALKLPKKLYMVIRNPKYQPDPTLKYFYNADPRRKPYANLGHAKNAIRFLRPYPADVNGQEQYIIIETDSIIWWNYNP